MRVSFRSTTYDIEPDQHSWRVAEVRENKKGEEYLANYSYFIRIEHMADHLLQESLLKADAKSLQELSAIAWELKNEVRQAFDL